MIIKRYPRYKDDMIMLWDSLRKSEYKRNYYSLVRVINKWLKPEQKKKQARKNKPYQRAEYPGQKVQVDVNFVPSYCVTSGNKYYQYTAIDECTRLVYRELYAEHSTYSSKDFLFKLVENFPFPIREIQTDNGTEFTNALLVKSCTHKSLFEQAIEDMDIIYHGIRVATPRHNSKVECQHRTDEKCFYKKVKMYSLEDGRKQLLKYNENPIQFLRYALNFLRPMLCCGLFSHLLINGLTSLRLR